ncbi:hypothetical protein [Furfurilactobacillus entadae]|uniref:hypothetical protein n=1 Tax=Furfurilactobacillus entadae TaxID=2922307 RepID=UPI0035E5A62B
MKNHFKAIIISLMTLTLICTLTACGKQSAREHSQPKTPVEQLTKTGQVVFVSSSKENLDESSVNDGIVYIYRFTSNHKVQVQTVSQSAKNLSIADNTFQKGAEADTIYPGSWKKTGTNKIKITTHNSGQELIMNFDKKIHGTTASSQTKYTGFSDSHSQTANPYCYIVTK